MGYELSAVEISIYSALVIKNMLLYLYVCFICRNICLLFIIVIIYKAEYCLCLIV